MKKPLIVFIIFIMCFSSCDSKKKSTLPILSFQIKEGKKNYYHITYNGFINQNGTGFNSNFIEGKIHITNFFFTNCPSICPPMRSKLIDVASYFKNDDDFVIVSITIDPERDTIPALKEYAMNTGITSDKWQFLRGDQTLLTNTSEKFMTNFKPNEDGTDFYHSSYVALVDRKQQIRGFYDLLKPIDIKQLKKDTESLLDE